MHIAFVTHGSFDVHATLKRATGMATPLFVAGHKITILMQDSKVNREKVILECPDARVCWHSAGLNPFEERRSKQNSLDKLQPDLVWICGIGLRNWLSKPKQGCVMLADHSELVSSINSSVFRRVLYWFSEWGHLFSFDAHVCASRYLENFYKRRFRLFGKENKVHYSPYAYHPKTMQQDVSGSEKLQGHWKGRKAIVYMGSLCENYGFWEMLEAFKNLSRRRDDFVAVFIGRGPEKEKGVEWINTNALNDVIHIKGYVSEETLPAYFSAAFAFLSPMRDTLQDWARCPSKLFMYLPYKRPIITCAIGEAKELLGDKGYYYQTGDISSLSTTLGDVLNASSEHIRITDLDANTYKARACEFLLWYNNVFNRQK